MYRIIAAFFLLVASVATSSAQPALFPSVWQNQQRFAPEGSGD